MRRTKIVTPIIRIIRIEIKIVRIMRVESFFVGSFWTCRTCLAFGGCGLYEVAEGVADVVFEVGLYVAFAFDLVDIGEGYHHACVVDVGEVGVEDGAEGFECG